MLKLENPVQMAVIGAAHGTKGEVRVKSFTADPMALQNYGIVYDKNGQAFIIETCRLQKDMLVIRFENVKDRNGAELLNGISLYVDRAQLPDNLEEDEFYQADMVGLIVRDLEGAEIGKVHAFFDFGGGDLLEIRIKDHKPMLIPFTKAAVPEISVSNGYIVVDPVLAGIVDDGSTREDEENYQAENDQNDEDKTL